MANWNTSQVTIMNQAFSTDNQDYLASTRELIPYFNQNISLWNTSLVTDMSAMFFGALTFNQSLATDGNKWDTSKVISMGSMFKDASVFNQNISTWNTSLVTDMSVMFGGALEFNQPLATQGNQWNTSLVTDMSYMFYEASAFNQNISSWNLSLKPIILEMFIGSAVPGTANNDAIYTVWNTTYQYTDPELIAAGLTTPTPTPTPTPIPTSNICFPAGTPIKTDQGIIRIDFLQPGKHTIKGQPILHITKTVTLDKYLIAFAPNSIGRNIPTARTIMTKDHQIEFEGRLVPAERFLDYSSEIKKVNYHGEILYNVLLANHSIMSVNGLVCETLHPENIMAKLYTNGYAEEERNAIVVTINESLAKRNLQSYKSALGKVQKNLPFTPL
jgi:surface protein